MTVIFNNKLCVCPLSVLTSQILLLYLLNERGKFKLSVCAVSGFLLELLHWTSNQDDDRFPSCWRGCRMSVKETRYWADVTLQLMFLHLGTSMFRGLHILENHKFSSHPFHFSNHIFVKVIILFFLLWICLTLKTSCGSIDLVFNFRHTNTITELWTQC